MDEPLIVNVAEIPARAHSRRATIINPEPDGRPWPEIGLNIRVMQPGQPNCRYHAQPVQEDFLVLSGECILIRGEEERRLREWDFVHCPPDTGHVFVGAGERPCAVLMIGSRRTREVHYAVNELAAKYDASVKAPTDDPAEAYADWRTEEWQPIPNPLPLYRPDGAS